MQEVQTSVFNREDTFFGVCQALGEDFGFHPNLLRLALAIALFWNPVAVLAGYAAVGVVIALTRWLVPNPRIASAPAETDAAQEAAEVEARCEEEALPLAA